MEDREKELVQYFIVNSDLEMSAGKVAAQVAHAATITTYDISKIAAKYVVREINEFPKVVEYFNEWFGKEQKKIVLKASEKELRALIEKHGGQIVHVIDNGHTEIPPNSLTVVALYPMPRGETKEFVNKRWRTH